jgi:hypothetical protein
VTSSLRWIEAPATWVSVWVSLDGRRVLDPLQEAILALVAAGVDRESQIRRHLTVAEPLIRAAAEELVIRDLLVRDGDTACLSRTEVTLRDSVLGDQDLQRTRTYSGWVMWDPRHGRLLPHVWLEDLPARPPEGLDVVPMDSHVSRTERPAESALEAELRLLPLLDGRTVWMPGGESGAQQIDGARIQTLSRKLDREQKHGSLWVPIEHRPTGLIVWHPLPHPCSEHPDSPLDPSGFAGLCQRRPDLESELRDSQDEARSAVVAEMLRESRYSSLDDLRRAAERSAERALGPAWAIHRRWRRTREALREAYIQQEMAVLVQSEKRKQAAGWADALDALTSELTEVTLPVIESVSCVPALSAGGRGDRLRRLLGPATLNAISNEAELKELRSRLKRDVDSIGYRIAALGLAAQIDDRVLCALERTREGGFDLFYELDQACKERNTATHYRRRDEEIEPWALRDRVVQIARALMLAGLP